MTNVTCFWLIFVVFFCFWFIFVDFLPRRTSFSSRLLFYVLLVRHWDGPSWLPSSVVCQVDNRRVEGAW